MQTCDFGTRRFVTTANSVAAARSNVVPGEMFRAMTRLGLLVQAMASSSMNRVEEASAAPAQSSTWQSATVTSGKLVMPDANDGKRVVAWIRPVVLQAGPP